MSELSNCFGNFVITYGADLMLCAVFCAVGFFVDDPLTVAVTEFINESISITVSADGASVCCVTVGCAGRSSYNTNILVTVCRNICGLENNMANGAFSVLCSAVNTIGILICDPV